MLLVAGIVWAKAATETPVAGQWINFVHGDPARAWIDEDGISHIRGQPYWVEVIGDLEGEAISVCYLNLDLATGNGDGGGTVTYNVSWGELSGSFEGRFIVTLTDWWAAGHGVAHGTGDFEGMKLMITLEGNFFWPWRDWEGIILDPHGE